MGKKTKGQLCVQSQSATTRRRVPLRRHKVFQNRKVIKAHSGKNFFSAWRNFLLEPAKFLVSGRVNFGQTRPVFCENRAA